MNRTSRSSRVVRTAATDRRLRPSPVPLPPPSSPPSPPTRRARAPVPPPLPPPPLDLAAIVDRSPVILERRIDDAATRAIARRGRGTPRIVNRLLKRVRDHAQVHGDGRVDGDGERRDARDGDRRRGPRYDDRKLLAAIVQKFASGPVGRGSARRRAVRGGGDDRGRDEPFLLRLGFIDRTPQGRIATDPAAPTCQPWLRDPAAPPSGAGDACRCGIRRSPVDAGRIARGRDARPPTSSAPGLRGLFAAADRRSTGRAPGDSRCPRRRRDAAVHAGRDERDGQGARPGRHPRRGAPIILSNTYHLYLRPGPRADRAARRPPRFMGWDGPILTDSGGFQVVSLGDLRVVDEDGVTFRSHLDGWIHRFTPGARDRRSRRRSARTSRSPRPAGLPELAAAEVADATERTHRWAERSLAAHTREDQALFGIVQGGLEPDLRAESTRFIAALPFDGIGIGGLAGDETPDAARRGARCRDPAAGRRSAAALPDGPRLAGGPARGRPPRASTCSTRCCRRGSPGTASCGSRAAG